MAGDTAQDPRLRSVLAELPALIVVLRGPDLVVELANPRRPGLPAGEQVEGMPAEEMLDIVLADPRDRARTLATMREVLATGRAARDLDVPVRFTGDTGVTHWDVTVVPIRGGAGEAPGGIVLFATDVTRLVAAVQRAEEAEHRFTALFEANIMGVAVSDEEWILEANDAYLTMVGRTRADLEKGLSWREITAPEYRATDDRALRSLEASGAVLPYEKEYVRPDGTRVAVLIGGTRISERPLRVLDTSYDLTARRRAEAAATALLARTRRLQEITATLSASNSAAAIARAVVHHGLEELGGSAGIMLRTDGRLTIEHAIGIDRELVEDWRAFPGTMPDALTDPSGTPEPAGDALPGGTLIAIPAIGADGGPLATLAVLFRDGRRLDDGDMDFLRALAFQAGLALDRARLYEDRAYVARKLQEGLLPDRLPDVPGLEAAVVYESISGGGEVGGDFYDVFESRPGRWFACVGDVSGKGTDAAVVTGLARHTVRAIARTTDRAADVLDFLNGALRRHAATPAFCTVGAACLVPRDGGGFEVEVCSGGHPFPLVLRADGALEEIEVIGTMLGVSDAPALPRVDLVLHPGDALVLYTDGVTDARRIGGERFGEERLLAAVRDAAGADAEGIAQGVESAVRAHLPGASADDRAIVVLRAAPR